VARVGDEPLSAALVGAIARRRSIAPPVALGDLVEDSLAAQGARAGGLAGAPDVRWASTVSLARDLSRHIWEEAGAQGAPTDDELAEVTVVHAVVLRSPSLPEAAALFKARAIADAVGTARTSEEFQARAKAASADVRASVEELPPFDVAGNMANGQRLNADFVVAAFSLRAPGETSPVVETPFGWHVIRLLSRVVPAQDQLPSKRDELAPAVFEERARARLTRAMLDRRGHTPIEVSEGADQLLAQVVLPP
jgi:hypothetical protein